jgi:hypothetical protein
MEGAGVLRSRNGVVKVSEDLITGNALGKNGNA